MSTHVTAFLITAIAYYLPAACLNAQFSFGTGKIGVLGGFASAIVLQWWLSSWPGNRSIAFCPIAIHFGEANCIACLALTVNLVCALPVEAIIIHTIIPAVTIIMRTVMT